MKVLALMVAMSLAAVAAGEAPSSGYGAPFHQAQPKPKAQPTPRQQPQQPQASAQAQSLPAFSAPAPFGPISGAGSRLLGRQFFIPAAEPSRLSDLYRLPNEYGPPPASFTTTTEAATTTTEIPTTVAPADFGLRRAEESGVYYVLQPDGRLQRIAYAHGPAPESAPAAPQQQRTYPGELSALQQPALSQGYLARFQYQDLHPAGAPIYTYGKAELVRIN